MQLDCKITTNSDDFMNAFNPEVTLILLDLTIPDMDGIELLRFLGKQQCKSDIVLMSGVDKRVLEVAQNFGTSIGLSVVDRLQKPFRLAELENVIKKNITSQPIIAAHPTIPQSRFVVTEAELKRAIENNEFVFHYQPKVEIKTNKLLGVEALIRWPHPAHGLLFPDEFISIAESFRLIDDISWPTIKNGLTDIEQINNKIKIALNVSFNLSPCSLHDTTYPDKFIALVNQSTIMPENIILEITESGLFKDLSSALDILTRLRMKNISLSIDDFGTGYAMMQQLKNIPATELKIDKSFIDDMLKQDSARVTVQKCIEIGHDLGMKVTAEGVETSEQLEFLRVNNCDIVQGYFFSKPLPMPGLLAWIETSKIKL